MNRCALFAATIGGLFLVGGCSSHDEENTLIIGAAASAVPLAKIAERHLGLKHDLEIEIVAASSGVIVQQLRFGAPYDLVVMPDRDLLEGLQNSSDFQSLRIQPLLVSSLVFWSPALSREEIQKALTEPGQQLVETIALANPAHAPYGKAADEFLDELDVEFGTILTANVQQSFEYARQGNVDAAFVPEALATGYGGAFVRLEQYDVDLVQQLGIVATDTNTTTVGLIEEFFRSEEFFEDAKTVGFRRLFADPLTPINP